MNFSFSEPTIKRVRRGTGYRVEGFAITGEEESTIWFAFESRIHCEIEDIGKAVELFNCFNGILDILKRKGGFSETTSHIFG